MAQPANLITKKPYRGINVFLLGFAGYGSQFWLTFNQAKQLGGNVRKGEHGTKIVFWKCNTRETESADGEIEERRSAFLRYYTVFNLEQTEGLKALLRLPPAFPIESAEEIVKGMPNPPAFEQDSRAAYIPSRDALTMPSRAAFDSQAEYYSTLFHELTHSTGHGKRLGREGLEKLQPFGSEDYSKEELVAEMGSAMLCGLAGIEQATISNSAAYLRSWINRLKADSRLVVSAARAALEAADYIQGESTKDSPSFTEQYFDSCGIFKDAVIAIVATVAKQERVRISERVKAGLETARARGKRLGRPRVVVDVRRIAMLRKGGASWATICRETGLSKGTAQRVFYNSPKNHCAGISAAHHLMRPALNQSPMPQQ